MPPHLRAKSWAAEEAPASDTLAGVSQNPSTDARPKSPADAAPKSSTCSVKSERNPADAAPKSSTSSVKSELNDEAGDAAPQENASLPANAESVVTNDTKSCAYEPDEKTYPNLSSTNPANGCPTNQRTNSERGFDLGYEAALGQLPNAAVHGMMSAAELVAPLLLNTDAPSNIEFVPSKSASPSIAGVSEISSKSLLQERNTTTEAAKSEAAERGPTAPPDLHRYVP